MISGASRSTAERSGGDEAWLDCHEWWREGCRPLFRDQPAVPLDG